MNKISKNMLNITALFIASCSSLNIEAKKYWFDVPFDTDIFQDMQLMHERMQQNIREIEDHFSQHNFESASHKVEQVENQKTREAQEKLERIHPEIGRGKEGDIEIKFPLEGIDKKSIEDIALQDDVLFGQLENNYGKIKFYITDSALKVIRNSEFKEEKSREPEEDKAKKEQAKDMYTYHYSYGSSNIYALPVKVDVSSARAEIKDDSLIIMLKPKNYSKIKIQK